MATRLVPAGPRVLAVRRRLLKVLGAVCGQLSQALGSFAIQGLAARELGASGLGLFALMYGAIVLGTAVSSGMIGDSLTVLDRHDRPTRAALQNWCLVVSSLTGAIATAAAWVSGEFSLTVSLLFGALTAVFISEDALRRSLMAVMRFWRLPLVDLTSLGVSLGWLAGCVGMGGRATLGQFLLALLLGQAVALLVALCLLPREERPILAVRTTRMRAVARFGAWRAAQQSVRPGLLTAARLVITLALGVAGYGRLEAARVYMAPALLIVAGVGSMLLPLWVSHRDEGVARLLRRADRTAQALFASTILLGVAGTAALPALGGVLTDGKFQIAAGAVFGWAFYAASTAAVTPYGTLAALQGKQGRVLLLRLLEPVIALLVLALALGPAHLGATSAPYALSIGAVLSGLGVRYRVLVPMTRTSARHRRGWERPVPLSGGAGQPPPAHIPFSSGDDDLVAQAFTSSVPHSGVRDHVLSSTS